MGGMDRSHAVPTDGYPRTLAVPELSLILLVGVSGSGKSTFAARHFRPTEVISSDRCRGLVCDDESDQGASIAAFEVLELLAAKRLGAGRLTVIDATNVHPVARKTLIDIARKHDCPRAAIVLDLPLESCLERVLARAERIVDTAVVRSQYTQLREHVDTLECEGFGHVHVLRTPDEIDGAAIERVPMPSNRKHERGPFDLIGDVHGCLEELRALVGRLGYTVAVADGHFRVAHPSGRKLVFVGDLVDRGPDTPGVLRFVMDAVAQGSALCVVGNHDDKLLRKLRGAHVRIAHGLALSLEQLARQSVEFSAEVATFLGSLVDHYVLDAGRLVVAHGGMRADLQGRDSRQVRAFALYGDTTGETDDDGYPVRRNWAADYRGQAMVVYGHTPVLEAQWQGNTIDIDTGCVFGGRLTALRYPEREVVHVQAARVYYEPSRPLDAPPG